MANRRPHQINPLRDNTPGGITPITTVHARQLRRTLRRVTIGYGVRSNPPRPTSPVATIELADQVEPVQVTSFRRSVGKLLADLKGVPAELEASVLPQSVRCPVDQATAYVVHEHTGAAVEQ